MTYMLEIKQSVVNYKNRYQDNLHSSYDCLHPKNIHRFFNNIDDGILGYCAII